MNDCPPKTLDAILDEQRRAWLDGSRPAVDELLGAAALSDDREALLDLLYNEIVLREELGESPALEEYVGRYPHLQQDLKVHFDVHRAVHDGPLLDTRRAEASDSVDDVESSSFELGPKLTHYEIVTELGRGGMGVVYKARHRGLKRFVAVKMFHPGRQPTPRELARFRVEAEAIARLQHPNIVQIFEVGQDQGLPFLALELAEQGTLAQKLQGLPFTPRAAAELVETLARAIQHAHDNQIVHRDLKPANVLFANDGVPKITDFGLAKILETDADAPPESTRLGEPIGTPRYMAPEQAAGQPDQVGPATDVYALGTVLFECLTGQVPFVSASPLETMVKIRRDEPPAPRRLQPAIPRDLETICLHCLQKQPDGRYATAQALADDLRRYLQGEPIHARPTPAWERAWKWSRRHPAWAALLGVASVLLFGGVVLLILREHRVARTRTEVALLVKEGQEALARQEVQLAQAKFEAALAKVLAEPALRDQELFVRGWLDHGIQNAEKQRWRKRQPPPLFDERRDDAFVQNIVLDRQPTGRDAIHAALEFAVDAAEREQLVLLEADLLMRDDDAAGALAVLDAAKGIESRTWHSRRADCLARLGRADEADQERMQAHKAPRQDAVESFWSGVDRFRDRDWTGAGADFDQVLSAQPDHFAGRLLQAVCFLRLKRASEAKVALTACIAQRPGFAWSYLFRSEAYLQLADHVSAAQDLQRSVEMKLNEPAQQSLTRALDTLNKAIEGLSQERRAALGNEKIATANGPRRLRDLPAFQAALAR
jgi:tetratricopeptide (TPR) repeat protein